MQTYWENSIDEYLEKERRRYLIRVYANIKIHEDTSQDMINLLIEIRGLAFQEVECHAT